MRNKGGDEKHWISCYTYVDLNISRDHLTNIKIP